MVLLGAVILPHGAMPFDGDPDSASPACRDRYNKLDPVLRENLSALYNGACDAGRTIADLKLDLIILHTPHGVTLSDAYGLYANDAANGNALWLNEWSEFTAEIPLDSNQTQEIKNHFQANAIDVQGIRSYGGLECKLRWGEAIPIWYLQKYLTNDPQFVIISNDTKPRPPAIEDWRLDVGKKLANFIAGIPEKVVVVISGDLSHYHPTDVTDPLYLPDPSSDMPVNPEGALAYEASIAQWVTSGTATRSKSDGKSSSQIWDPVAAFPYIAAAVAQDPDAGACGTKGFVLLHGLMAEEVDRGATFTSELVIHRVPTYYGMLAATFLKS